jgi:preprotein translocase subunit SecA
MSPLLDSVFAPSRHDAADIRKINAIRRELAQLNEEELNAFAREAKNLVELFAATAAIASRSLGQEMFDVQL